MNTTVNENKGSLVEADEPFVAIKSESGKWWKMPKLLPKSLSPLKPPSLLRRGARAAIVYALSYMVVKALDKARKENPGNQVVSSADEIAHAFFYFENLIVSGAVAVVKTGYDTISSPQPLPEQAALTLTPPAQKNEATLKAEPKKPATHKHHINRANLNTVLAPDDLSAVGIPEASTTAALGEHIKPDAPIAVKSPQPIP